MVSRPQPAHSPRSSSSPLHPCDGPTACRCRVKECRPAAAAAAAIASTSILIAVAATGRRRTRIAPRTGVLCRRPPATPSVARAAETQDRGTRRKSRLSHKGHGDARLGSTESTFGWRPKLEQRAAFGAHTSHGAAYGSLDPPRYRPRQRQRLRSSAPARGPLVINLVSSDR